MFSGSAKYRRVKESANETGDGVEQESRAPQHRPVGQRLPLHAGAVC
jgi:hypothetical protein